MAQREPLDIAITAFKEIYFKTIQTKPPFGKGAIETTIKKWLASFQKQEKGLNTGRIVDYMIAQCYTWREPEKWTYLNINSYFGPKAIERFYSSKPGIKYYQDEWLKEKGLSREKFKASFVDTSAHPMRKYIYMDSEEDTKFRFHNTNPGYLICLESTLLWSPLSKACSSCTFIQKCQEELRRKMPELYRIRKEHVDGRKEIKATK